jgi:hypothetical protein
MFPADDVDDNILPSTEATMDNIITSYYTTCTPSTYLVHRAHTSATPSTTTSTAPITTKSPGTTRDFEALRSFFGYLPSDVIKHTFEATTQNARIPMSTVLKKRYKSPKPAMNMHRRNEYAATDTLWSDTPAILGGQLGAQVFVGTTSLVTDVEGIKTDKQFVNTREDNIRRRGAPTKLISDRAQAEISNKVKDILRSLLISARVNHIINIRTLVRAAFRT